jgi:Concanavalin A-like lectin/glucanases superfamily
MGIAFNGTSDYLRINSALGVTGPPFTICLWYYVNSLTADHGLFDAVNSAGDSDGHWLSFKGTSGGDPLEAGSVNQGVSLGAALTGASGVTAGPWNFAAGRFNNAAARDVVSNTLSGGNTTNVLASGPSRLNFGQASLLATFLNGGAARMAVYSAALTGEELNAVYLGFSPLRIRPQSLVCYIDGVRDAKQLRSASTGLTINGTSNAGTHPRSYGF